MMAVVIALSLLFGIPYAYSILGFAAWIFFGHLITIDDDSPGGFSNPEESRKVWHSSLKELGIKLLVLLTLGLLVLMFPVLHEFGAK